MQQLKNAGLIGSLFTLILYFVWCIKTQTPAPHMDTSSLEKLSDVRVTHLQVKAFNEQGTLTHRLDTTFMQHIPYESTYQFSSPVLTLIQPLKPTWIITANEAIAKQDGEEITLNHQVVLQHKAFEQQPAGRIETEILHYFPKKNIASTPAMITWKQADNYVLSRGFEAYFDESRIELYQARATYEPLA